MLTSTRGMGVGVRPSPNEEVRDVNAALVKLFIRYVYIF